MDIEKYENIVHHIIYFARNADTHEKIGHTKLNKLLYYIDFSNYYKNNRSVTEDTYIKHQYGPVPKHIGEVLQSLKEKKKILEIPEFFGDGHQRKTLMPNVEPDSDKIANNVFRFICDRINRMLRLSAKEISDLSHDIVWKSFEIGENIPYYMSYIVFGSSNIEKKDIEWAKGVFQRSCRRV